MFDNNTEMTMQRFLDTRYFSVKIKNKRGGSSRRSLRSIRNCSMKSKSSSVANVESHDDLIEKQDEIMDEFEETRLREESMAQNLKLMKKQKTRLARLQKILSRNVILIPLCAVFTILSVVTLLISTSTDYYQYVSYDFDILMTNIESENNISYERIAALSANKSMKNVVTTVRNTSAAIIRRSKKQVSKKTFNFLGIGLQSVIDKQMPDGVGDSRAQDRGDGQLSNDIYVFKLEKFDDDLFFLFRTNYFKNTSTKMYPIYSGHSGVWRTCNYLSEKALDVLNIETCNFYPSLFNFRRPNPRSNTKTSLNEEYLDQLNYNPGRDLIRMYNVSACCVIVSCLMMFSSLITALLALVSKSVPVTIITSVLNSMISVFIILLLAIIHRKIWMQQQEDCLDINRDTFGLIVCSSRHLSYGWSLGLTWIVVIISALNSVCWFHIAKMQKLLFTHGYYYN